MTGYPNFNFEAFHSAAAALRSQGFIVYNPAESFNGAQDLPWTTYMKNDYDAIVQCGAVMVLEGWEKALGSVLEVLFGLSRGMSIFKKTGYGHEKLFSDKGDDTRNDIKLIIESFGRPKIEAKTEAPSPIFNSVWTATNNTNYNIATTSGSYGSDFIYVQVGDYPPIGDFVEGKVDTSKIKDLYEEDETILEEAQRLVHGDRGTDYGHPFFDFSRTAKIWSAILDIQVTPEKVALCMVGLKISREVNMPKRDNRVDGAGYFETLQMVMDKKKELGL